MRRKTSGLKSLFVFAALAVLSLGHVQAQVCTENRIAKFLDSSCTQTDSIIFEDPNGNIGIGTNSPTEKLTLQTPTGSYGFIHTDGNIAVGSWLGPLVDGQLSGAIGTQSNHPLVFFAANSLPRMTIGTGGNVGIGTTTPAAKLDIAAGNVNLEHSSTTAGNILKGGVRFLHNFGSNNTFLGQNAGNLTMTGHTNTAIGAQALSNNTSGSYNTASGRDALLRNTAGVGNTASGALALNSNTTGFDNTAMGGQALYANTTGNTNTAIGASALFYNTTGSNNTVIGAGAGVCPTCGNLTNATAIGAGAIVSRSNSLVLGNNANVGIGTANPAAKLDVAGMVKANVVQITGADFSEKFDVRQTKGSLEPGMVVAIDPENAGKLVLSTTAYNRRVIGILSGAGGINPGMLMGQPGTLADGDHPVALSGRVYVWVDASNGPIVPGDLLTTSNVPGHAMKVTNYGRAQGATIGKAMTGLAKGRGLVLAVVALQ